jgi:uncharacterized membrane protein
MGRKNMRRSASSGNTDNCPICGVSVKSKNLSGHLKKVHPNASENDLKNGSKSKNQRNRMLESKKADRRKELMKEKRRKQDIMFLCIVGIIIGGIIGFYFYNSNSTTDQDDDSLKWEPQPVEETPNEQPPDNNNGQNNEPSTRSEVTIPISSVNDGKAHFYNYDSSGVKIRYFVLKSSDGVYRAAFDTCDVCYDAKKGYHQENDVMVCNNCGQRFSSVKINEEKGGCNPAPLDRSVEGNNLIIKHDDIENGRWYFV